MTTSKPASMVERAFANFEPAVVNKLRAVMQDAHKKATTVVLVGSKAETKAAASALAQGLGRSLVAVGLAGGVSGIESVVKKSDPGQAILLFDEGDALFGKRSEVKDSHDRYANAETALTHLRSYAGLSLIGLSTEPDAATLKGVQHVVHVASK